MKDTIKKTDETVSDPLMSESMSQGLNQEKQRKRLKKPLSEIPKKRPRINRSPIRSGDE